MQYPKTHPAVRLVREGRYTMIVAEIDVALVGGGESYHVVGETTREPVCGQGGKVGEILVGVDARALLVGMKPICGRCRGKIGDVPGPRLAEDVDGGHAIGVTRTDLDRERRRALKAA